MRDVQMNTALNIINPNDCVRELWIFGESINGEFASVVYELLGKGKELADELSSKIAVVVLGSCSQNELDKLFVCGADVIYHVNNPMISYHYDTEVYPGIVSKLVAQYKPEIFLLGATSLGCSIAPRISTMLKTGLTADCTKLEVDAKTRLLRQTRPTNGGNKLATIICENRRPQMATVRPRVLPVPDSIPGRSGTLVKCNIDVQCDKRIELLSHTQGIVQQDISSADIIVSVGMGIKNDDDSLNKSLLAQIKELAKELNAPIGATRAVVDMGWGFEHEDQIGQTGKTVRPKIYIACGISGSCQHCAGIRSADRIIAINSDVNAPIHSIATWSIVQDLNKAIPAILSAWRA